MVNFFYGLKNGAGLAMNKENEKVPENGRPNLEFVMFYGNKGKEFEQVRLIPEIKLYRINEDDDEGVCVHEAAWIYSTDGDLLEEELAEARKAGADQARISELEAELARCRENENKMYEEHWAQEKAVMEYYNAHPEELEKIIESAKTAFNE